MFTVKMVLVINVCYVLLFCVFRGVLSQVFVFVTLGLPGPFSHGAFRLDHICTVCDMFSLTIYTIFVTFCFNFISFKIEDLSPFVLYIKNEKLNPVCLLDFSRAKHRHVSSVRLFS